MNKQKEFFNLYNQLSSEQKTKIFGEEKEKLDTIAFMFRLFNEPDFYKAVEKAIGEEAYWELRAK